MPSFTRKNSHKFYHGEESYAEVFYSGGESESYAQVYLADINANIKPADVDGTLVPALPVLDTEADKIEGKNLIVVGGSCVNRVAAELLGVTYKTCGADWPERTKNADGTGGVGLDQYLIETFSRSTGKVATLVAGFNVGDTQNAATYLKTQSVDTSVGKKYIGTTATTATLQTA